jgi:hypothetical protein
MRKQCAAARGLVAQRAPERRRIDRRSTRSSCPAKCRAAVSATCSAVEKWMKPSARSTGAPVNARPFGLAPERRGAIL